MDNVSSSNAERFNGFSDTYENARPSMPLFPIQVIKQYLMDNPKIVVDLGSGTGLSTQIWQGNCKKVIGVEPNDEMRQIAIAKQLENVTFIKGYAHETGLAENSVNAIVCSQSFHWMEPAATLAEVNRILMRGGVFASVDCDWPPVSHWEAEQAYTKLFDKVHAIEESHPSNKDTFIRYEKNKHLENMQNSGYFRYVREITFSNAEKCTADRLINLALSQGSLRSVLKANRDLVKVELDNYKSLVHRIFTDEIFDIEFSYRMRIAVK